ncbi:MAG: transporter substrate-binding domain-containing protein [Clostridiales bacterium]|nr:transporter substrate-binding domain-containing protein [Clostridiales bacterium]
MKRWITLMLAAVMALSLVACGTSGKQSTYANRLEKIKAQGYIEVTTEPYFAPYEFIDSSKSGDEQYVGMDMELAKAIAADLGVELRIVPLEFSAVQAGVAEGKYDLAISAMAYSPERAETIGMSEGYYFDETGYGLLVRTADLAKYTGIDSLADAVVVTQSGSVQESLVNNQVSKYKEFKRVSAMTDGMLMVGENKADVCVVDTANGQLYADANPGYNLSIVPGFTFTVDKSMEGVRVGAPKGEQELLDAVNGTIERLLADDQFTQWYSEYTAYAKTLGIE